MHPKQICDDLAFLGSPLVLDGDDLYIEHPENVYPELVEFVQSHKKRLIQYLKGEYSMQDHKVKQTIDKIINYFMGIDQEMNPKIDDWFNHDWDAATKAARLLVLFWGNGWRDLNSSVSNFEDEVTDKLSLEIYERAISYFKGKKA
ncbi:hypothetical protein NSQ93_08965 [Bacillus sp. FSL W8-0445]|uniref:Uncharacterized protein n=2 Tax=Bacillus licheniformis TaxID=1402 RepID=A0A8B5YJB5_BACLI|nr:MULTISPECIES: hypothetical protein [Bacillus]AWV42258.1 hypothetical protein CD200_18195 [Bacillus licheniformis]AZN77961.1 hypothetical protein CXG95_02135 [Bacillus licheniformis]KYC97910.1 hypothetical protein B4164_3697 [Bacillus licheniformis]MCC2132135.1 hypothetical protein [Bacillus licheniformis]MCC2144508.1 hypothetical protein [Bacillus licheniformis]